MGYVYVFLMVLMTTTGQLLAKKGSQSLITGGKMPELFKSCFNRYIILAVVITTAAPMFYILALKELSLSLAFAFTGLNYVFVSLGGKFFFGEKLNGFHYTGMFLIFLGIAVFSH